VFFGLAIFIASLDISKTRFELVREKERTEPSVSRSIHPYLRSVFLCPAFTLASLILSQEKKSVSPKKKIGIKREDVEGRPKGNEERVTEKAPFERSVF
jgi:hypothetical protein